MTPSIFPSRWPARLQTVAVYGLVIGNMLWAVVATRMMHVREKTADKKAALANFSIQRADSLFRCLRATRALPCR